MSTTPLANLPAAKPDVGTEDNAWGTLLNELFDLFDTAVAGAISIPIAAGSVVLQQSQWPHAAIELIGSTGGGRTVTVPDTSKLYWMRDGTEGGNPVSIKVPAGADVPLPAGSWVLVLTRGDGTDPTLLVSDAVDDGAVTTAKIADAAVVTEKIGDAAVVLAKLGDAAVETAKLANAAVTTAKLANAAVATAKLANGAVTGAKISTAGASEGDVLRFDGTKWVPAASSGPKPGDYRMTARTAAYPGWLMCNGQAVSRITYADLFAAIGITYGAGNGVNTFNVPRFNGRGPIGAGQGATAEGGGAGSNRALGASGGAETHTQTAAQVGSHDHDINSVIASANNGNAGGELGRDGGSGNSPDFTTRVNRSQASVQPMNNMPPFLVTNFMIKT